jgi:membrane-anchored protein YejM (alkaline phosphatase superfamily)
MRWPFSRRLNRARGDAGGEDFLLVTWDSCRFDTYQTARTPRLDEFGQARRAWAMGTYTLPAHVAMFYGFLPHVFEPLPFYNRHVQQLWRISHRNLRTRPLVTFPGGASIVTGFRKRGYFTTGIAAMDWFRDTAALREGFEHFRVTGIDAEEQNRQLFRSIERGESRPCFAFINYGETHSPFRYRGMKARNPVVDSRYSLPRILNQRGVWEENWSFDREAFESQVACAEFLDARTGELIDFFKGRSRPTTVVVCADHGECFGENGLYGHGFYHEKVMEIPMLLFRLNAPPHPEPAADSPDNETEPRRE